MHPSLLNPLLDEYDNINTKMLEKTMRKNNYTQSIKEKSNERIGRILKHDRLLEWITEERVEANHITNREPPKMKFEWKY